MFSCCWPGWNHLPRDGQWISWFWEQPFHWCCSSQSSPPGVITKVHLTIKAKNTVRAAWLLVFFFQEDMESTSPSHWWPLWYLKKKNHMRGECFWKNLYSLKMYSWSTELIQTTTITTIFFLLFVYKVQRASDRWSTTVYEEPEGDDGEENTGRTKLRASSLSTLQTCAPIFSHVLGGQRESQAATISSVKKVLRLGTS